MSAVQMWKIDPETIPLPGAGSVLLFVNMAGVLCHKTATGEVLDGLPSAGPAGAQGPQGMPGVDGATGAQGPQGEAATVLVPALSVGAYAVLLPSGSVLGVAIGSTITTDGANLSGCPTNGGANVALTAGQVWRYMGGCVGGGAGGFMFQRVS